MSERKSILKDKSFAFHS